MTEALILHDLLLVLRLYRFLSIQALLNKLASRSADRLGASSGGINPCCKEVAECLSIHLGAHLLLVTHFVILFIASLQLTLATNARTVHGLLHFNLITFAHMHFGSL